MVKADFFVEGSELLESTEKPVAVSGFSKKPKTFGAPKTQLLGSCHKLQCVQMVDVQLGEPDVAMLCFSCSG